MSINIDKIVKSFGNTRVLNDISLDIESGEMVALLGPSGSGKTTLLRIIAGLEHQNSGTISFHGHDVSHLHARDRHVGFMFQHYALFRHMTVADNIAFGLTVLPRRERPSAADIRKKVSNLLEMVQLTHLANRYPAQLSGGQKQRVALARALAVDPQILLLDEPFGALDAQVRKELRRWLRQLHEELKFTSVFVTHDQEEAMEVADRIVVMSQGNIEQTGTPERVWEQPESRFVLEFLGEINRLPGQIQGERLQVADHHWPISANPYSGEVELFLRPWETGVSREASASTPLAVKVLEVSPRGHYWQVVAAPQGWQGSDLTLVLDQQARPPVRGEQLFIGIDKARIYQGDQRLQAVAFAKSA